MSKYSKVLDELFGSADLSKYGIRKDDSANVLAALPNQLTQVETEILDVKTVPLAFRKLGILKGGYNAGLQTVRFPTSEAFGEAKQINPDADDLPLVNEKVGYVDVPFLHFGDAYAFGLQELASAALSGRPLDSSLALIARNAIERKLDSFIGQGNSDFKGILNHASIPVSTASDTFKSGSPLSPINVALELLAKETLMISNSFGEYVPSKVCMSAAAFGFLNSTYVQPTYNTMTIWQAYMASSVAKPEVVLWEQCKTAGSGSTEIIAFYDMKPENFQVSVSRDLQVEAPERRGLRIINNLWSSCTPATPKRPLAGLIVDGIGSF